MSLARRREFLHAAGALLIASADARSQPAAKPYRIGVLATEPHDRLQQGLRELGYFEGPDVIFEFRYVGGMTDRLDAFAAELVRLKVDVIVAPHPAAVLSARRATATIPIVMVNAPDPVTLGFVASLARPGGNVTGLSTLSADLSLKQLELLKVAIPGVSRIALLWNPDNPWHPATVNTLKANSGSLGLKLQAIDLRGPDAFNGAFRAMATERAQAVLVLADPIAFAQRRLLADLAIRHRLPMMGNLQDFAEAGSLMAYWADLKELYRRTASFIDRILKGAKPGSLPVEQPTKFELVVNLATARAIGIALPQALLLRADRIIE